MKEEWGNEPIAVLSRRDWCSVYSRDLVQGRHAFQQSVPIETIHTKLHYFHSCSDIQWSILIAVFTLIIGDSVAPQLVWASDPCHFFQEG